MAKLKPKERWKRVLLERFLAFRLSGELRRLRVLGLKALGRRRLLTTLEYSRLPLGKDEPARYSDWRKECEEVGKRFGLAPWTVMMACLLRTYKPESDPFPMATSWPRMRVVTTVDDRVFLKHLFHHAVERGLPVLLEQGGHKTTIVFLQWSRSVSALPPSHRPQRNAAFTIELELPPDYPSEARQEMAKQSAELQQEILRCLGYYAPRRVRSSRLTDLAKTLKMDQRPLPRLGAYMIIDKLDDGDDDMTYDQQKRRTISSQRYKLKKRLVDPFETDRNVGHGSTAHDNNSDR